MRRDIITLWKESEYQYPLGCGFIPNIRCYLHEDGPRPAMIIVPGGGYQWVAAGEGDLVARRFYKEGFQCFVLTYTTDPLQRIPLCDQPMRDLARAVRLIRARGGELGVIPDQVVLCGFSAGGHVCGSVLVHHRELDEACREREAASGSEEFSLISCRPDAAILCYPVITTGKYAHRGSFVSLVGVAPSKEELSYHSLETQVTGEEPPCFLWHTAEDSSVPMENSLAFAMALKAHGVPFGYHIFPRGKHGLSLADEEWARGHYAENYTFEQPACMLRAIESGALPASEEEHRKIAALAGRVYEASDPVPEVTAWPEMALAFLRNNTAISQSYREV